MKKLKDLSAVIANSVFGTFINEGIIKKPQMRYLVNDRGISNTCFDVLFKNKKIKEGIPLNEYCYMMCFLSFGAGAFFTEKQWSLNKTVCEFSDLEIDALFAMLSKEDAISLGFSALGIKEGSYNYDKITKAIGKTFLEIYENIGEYLEDNQNLKGVMQIYFNLGVTLVYERLEK